MNQVLRVLVVDDSAYVRKVIKQMLSRSPFIEVVGAARDHSEALAMVEELNPDVVTLDLMMPGIDGFTVLDMMKADVDLRDIPVIVITAKDLTSKDYKRLSGRVESLLQKGEFMEEELFESISDVLK